MELIAILHGQSGECWEIFRQECSLNRRHPLWNHDVGAMLIMRHYAKGLASVQSKFERLRATTSSEDHWCDSP
jgi:hypothetical protein